MFEVAEGSGESVTLSFRPNAEQQKQFPHQFHLLITVSSATLATASADDSPVCAAGSFPARCSWPEHCMIPLFDNTQTWIQQPYPVLPFQG